MLVIDDVQWTDPLSVEPGDGWREPLGRYPYCSSELVRTLSGRRYGLLCIAVGAASNPLYLTDDHRLVCQSDR